MRRLWAAIPLLLAAVLMPTQPTHASNPTPYQLPALGGTPLHVTQGNGDGNHDVASGSQYAFDFATNGYPGNSGIAAFRVTAARAGTIIGLRTDAHVSCPDLSCWTQANYVLIDHGDGTSGLYLHLLSGGPALAVGDQVAQGEEIGFAGSTGYASGIHLHFMVEQTPRASGRTVVGWWWTSSVPVTFSDPDVVRQDPDGVPKAGQVLVAGSNRIDAVAASATGPTASGRESWNLRVDYYLSGSPTPPPGATLAVFMTPMPLLPNSVGQSEDLSTQAGTGTTISTVWYDGSVPGPRNTSVLVCLDFTWTAAGATPGPGGGVASESLQLVCREFALVKQW